MTYLKKWTQKIAEAKDGNDFLCILSQMAKEHHEKYCLKMHMNCDVLTECHECKACWLDSEVREDNTDEG